MNLLLMLFSMMLLLYMYYNLLLVLLFLEFFMLLMFILSFMGLLNFEFDYIFSMMFMCFLVMEAIMGLNLIMLNYRFFGFTFFNLW